MNKTEMRDRQTLQIEFLKRKCLIHGITYLEAIKRYGAKFERIYNTFKRKENMRLVHQNHGLKVFLTNTKAVAADKRRGDRKVAPQYSLYQSSLSGDIKLNAAPYTASEVKENFNRLINMTRPQIDVVKLLNLEE